MRPIKLNIKNIGPYVDETIDFSGIPGDIIAIVGQNGSGKTMMVESLFAALYREFPSRDSIYRYVTGRAQITLDFYVGEHRYRSVINIDPKKREMEPWLFATDGEERALTDGRSVTFDAEIEKLCGPEKVALASTFAAQNKTGSFASLPKAKRKELFINMLGLEKLQYLSERAAIKESSVTQAYTELAAKASFLQDAASKVHGDIKQMQEYLDSKREEHKQLESDIPLESYEVGLLKGKIQSSSEMKTRRLALRGKQESAKTEIESLMKQIQATKNLEKRLPELWEVMNKYTSLESDIDKLRLEQASLQGAQTDYHRRATRYIQTVKELEKNKQAALNEAQATKALLERAGNDAKTVDTVPCQGVGECASCQFILNAVAARESLADLEAQMDMANANALAIEEQIKAIPKMEIGDLNRIIDKLVEVERRIKTFDDNVATLNQSRRDIVKIEEALKSLEFMNSRVSDLGRSRLEISSELVDLDKAIEELSKIEADLEFAEADLAKKQRRLSDLSGEILTISGKLSTAIAEQSLAEQAARDLAEITPKLQKLDLDRRSWNLLSKAFSKTGIQSLEIDSAGPAVSEIVNDLLFSCFGPRFSVRFVTQVLKDDKTGYKDDFDVYVTDSSTGREGSIDDLSGGEKVIVSEGISLAIALFNRSRVNTGWSTIFRDEASSAVDDTRAPLYIQMLRRAKEQGHFQGLFFIAHQERVTEGADAKVLVNNGRVSLE